MENKTSNISLEDRKRLNISGVASVDSFAEEKIKLTTSLGRLTIGGEKLKIVNFSVGTGAFTCEGKIDSLVFSKPRESVLGRLFK